MEGWRSALRGDPVPWLLEREDPAVRHLALRALIDEPADAPVVRRARAAAMRVPPISAILENLLVNASRHTPADAHIWVRVRPSDIGAILCGRGRRAGALAGAP